MPPPRGRARSRSGAGACGGRCCSSPGSSSTSSSHRSGSACAGQPGSRSSGRAGGVPPELEDELEAVLFVHVLAGPDEAQLADDGERRRVVRSHRENEVLDARPIPRPVHQHRRGLRRIAAAAVRWEDPVAELDRIRCLLRVQARRAVLPGVADHLTAENDSVWTPRHKPIVLAHLPQPQAEEALLSLGRKRVRQLDAQECGGLVAPPVEHCRHELGRHRAELDHNTRASIGSSTTSPSRTSTLYAFEPSSQATTSRSSPSTKCRPTLESAAYPSASSSRSSSW